MKNYRRLRRFILSLLVAAILIPVLAGPSAVVARPHLQGPEDPTELEAFVDGVMEAQLAANHVAGATVAIVAEGELLFAKGYGYANVTERVPVDPATTLFRPGSVSKLFTWTAVMQLVEEGEIDLNEEVNAYLDFEIPDDGYDEPITMIHLLTHTPGFEDRTLGIGAFSAEEVPPLGEWLANNIPARVRPPGRYSAYSNYGSTLAGYIVGRVSGMPYEEYVEKRILEPLGMEHSTFVQPLPEELSSLMSGGYRYDRGSFEELGFEYLIPGPAGALSSTATDMARFMLAYLGEGCHEGSCILEPETARRILDERLFTHDERLNGWTYGWMELDANGERVVGHGGDTYLFHNLLVLLPDEELGIYVSYNSVAGAMLPQAFVAAFLDHYYPTIPVDLPTPPEGFANRAERVTGAYRANRGSYTTAEKVTGLFTSFNISLLEDEALLVTTPFGPQRFVETEPLLFRQVTGDDLLLFEENDEGEITHAYLDSFPMMAMEKLAWYEVPLLHYLLLGVSLLLFLSYLVAAPVYYYVRRTYDRDRPGGAFATIARWNLGMTAVLALVSLVVTIIALSNTIALMTGETTLLQIAGALNVIIVIFTLEAVIFTFVAWMQRYWRFPARLHYTLVTLGAVGFVWFLYYWNLLGWQL